MTVQFNNEYMAIRNDKNAMEKAYGFDLRKYKGKTEIRKVLRNCVVPEIGKYVFEKITEQN